MEGRVTLTAYIGLGVAWLLAGFLFAQLLFRGGRGPFH